MGPIARFFLGTPEAPQQAGMLDGLKTMAKQVGMPGAAQLANRPAQVEAAVNGAPAQAAPARAPGQMTPDQMSDWQAVGLGQMKLGEFRAKHGFLPN